MLTARQIDRDEAPFKRAAAIDARRRNVNGKTHFTDKQVAKAFGIQDALQLCYRGRFFDEPNWRAGRAPLHRSKFAAIKIEGASMKDRKALDYLTKGWDIDPSIVVDLVETPQGLTYRIYFT